MTATLTQAEALLAYLNRWGEVTPMEALRELHIYRLAGRVHDLRQRGHNIRTDRMPNGAARYVLVRPQRPEVERLSWIDAP